MKYLTLLLATVIVATLVSAVKANCKTGWTEMDGHCYWTMNQRRKTWEDADEMCRMEAPEGSVGHLVTIDSPKENKFVCEWWTNLTSRLTSKWQYLWTGLNDIENENEFVWNDGTRLLYKNWGGHQPDNRFGDSNCVTIAIRKGNEEGKWDDARCFARRAFMCEYTCTDCSHDKNEKTKDKTKDKKE